MQPLALQLLLAALSVVAAPQRQEPADLVLRGGRIVTLDDERPQARALAARGDTIVFVGDDQGAAALIGDATRVVELEGRLAVPGFIEGHGHFMGVGDAGLQLDLRSVSSWDEVVALVAAAVARARPGELIRGRGWHQEKWQAAPEPSVEGLPTHHWLSAVSPDNPVVLRHASGHATFANARAMELAGVARGTPDPPGGQIVRDAGGEPTGAFRETAAGLLARASRGAVPPDPRRVAELAVAELLSKGVTSFQDAGSSFAEVELYRQMAADGSLRVRLWVMLSESDRVLAERLPGFDLRDFGRRHLTVRAIKRSIDGALGSHGAWLLEPYADLPQSTGLNTTPVASIEETARLALAHGFQLCVHAIGDRANRETLDLYQRAFAALPERRDLRWRIEHAQHLHPDDVPRFARLGVVASMQGVHCTSDGPWVTARLGAERAASGAYLWRDLLDSGALVSNGTDAPVEDVDPIASFHSTVTRRLADGSSFFPAQCMTRLEALRSYTLSAARAAFEEDVKGSLSVGKLADVTVLSRDILTVPADEILACEVIATIVGGEVVYERAAR